MYKTQVLTSFFQKRFASVSVENKNKSITWFLCGQNVPFTCRTIQDSVFICGSADRGAVSPVGLRTRYKGIIGAMCLLLQFLLFDFISDNRRSQHYLTTRRATQCLSLSKYKSVLFDLYPLWRTAWWETWRQRA